MLAHFDRLKGLSQSLEHGLAIYDESKEEFKRLATFSMKEKWRAPHGHPFRIQSEGTNYFYFGDPFPNVRVEADMRAITNPAMYQAWSCLEEGELEAGKGSKVKQDASGHLVYRWTTNALPVGAAEEKKLISAGVISPEESYFQPVDTESGKRIQMHGGSVFWNEYRKRWVMIAVEIFGSSVLGEVWYAEAKELTGPWSKTRKIVTHDNYSFYNPVHHPFFDQEKGKIIYFEGTYTAEFSGNKNPTPRYDYNQVMYRLDLGDNRLRPAQE